MQLKSTTVSGRRGGGGGSVVSRVQNAHAFEYIFGATPENPSRRNLEADDDVT